MKFTKRILAAIFAAVMVQSASGQNNWFAGAGVGVNTSCSKEIGMFTDFSIENNLGLDVFAGSWLNSSIGIRAGYRGISTSVGYGDDYYSKSFKSGEKVNFNFFHGDIMWDAINTFSGSSKGRFYSIVPYVGAGVEVLKAKSQDIKTAICGGIFNNFRINKFLCVYVDLSAAVTENPVHLKKSDGKLVVDKSTSLLARPMYIPSFYVGVAYAPGKKGGRNGAGSGYGRSRSVDSCWGLPAPRMPKK